jgi:hypothetical protein
MTDERDRRRTPLARPAEERTADQSTQEAGGLHAGPTGVRSGGGPEVAQESEADSVLERSARERYRTPRRYEDDDRDAAMPSNDSSLNTKI